MKKILLVLMAVWLTVSLTACFGKGEEKKSCPATEEGARQLLSQFLDATADLRALTLALQPTQPDCAAYFDESLATQAYNYYATLYGKSDTLIKPESGQTKILLFSATVEELRQQTEKAKMFPGGYDKVAAKIKPGFTVYKFKFVKPGEEYGTTFDGLVYVNNRWVMFPKPWRAAE